MRGAEGKRKCAVDERGKRRMERRTVCVKSTILFFGHTGGLKKSLPDPLLVSI